MKRVDWPRYAALAVCILAAIIVGHLTGADGVTRIAYAAVIGATFSIGGWFPFRDGAA